MITIKNVKTLDNEVIDYSMPSSKEEIIDAEKKLTLFPGIVDPHLCLGSIHDKDHWNATLTSLAKAGITTILEIPTMDIPCSHQRDLEEKRNRVEERLLNLKLPLRCFLYARADLQEVEGLGVAKKWMKGIVLSPGFYLQEWDSLFQTAAWQNIPIIINSSKNNKNDDFKKDLIKAIEYTEKHNNRLYVLNVSTPQELDLIQSAKKRSQLIYAETTLEHLSQKDSTHAESLWKALQEGIIETIGSGYFTDEQEQDRILFKGEEWSLLHPLFLFPFLLSACSQGKISKECLAKVTGINIYSIFDIEKTRDIVLVDLDKEFSIQKITKNGREDKILKGWPVYTIGQNQIIKNTMDA